MPWDAHLDWSEQLYTLMFILPAPIIVVALLWYFAPRIYRKKNRGH